MLKHSFLILIGVILLVLFCNAPVLQGEQGPLVLGIVPSRQANRMIITLDGLAELIAEEIGVPVKAYVASCFTGLIEAFGTKKVDFGFLGSSALIMAENRCGVKIILSAIRNGASTYQAQFSVRADGGLDSLADLKGKRLAFVDPASTSGFQFPYVFLLENGIDPEYDLTYCFAGSHDAALIGVYNGDFDACATFHDGRTEISQEYPDVLEVLKILACTNPIPNLGVGVRPGLEPALVERIQQAFFDLLETERGQELFLELYDVTDFVLADSAQFAPVRRTIQIIEEIF